MILKPDTNLHSEQCLSIIKMPGKSKKKDEPNILISSGDTGVCWELLTDVYNSNISVTNKDIDVNFVLF